MRLCRKSPPRSVVKDVHIAFGVLTITLNTAACLFGAWCWWRATPNLSFYGLLPLAVSFIGEQLRISSAESVLDSRGFESAAQVGELPEDEQRGIVTAIVQRETGVMTLAAFVIVVLLARAAGTA